MAPARPIRVGEQGEGGELSLHHVTGTIDTNVARVWTGTPDDKSRGVSFGLTGLSRFEGGGLGDLAQLCFRQHVLLVSRVCVVRVSQF